MQGPMSQIGLMRNDMCYAQNLTKAAKTDDPVERMKIIVTNFIAAHHINPTLASFRSPLFPILGETLQHEFPTGEKIFME